MIHACFFKKKHQGQNRPTSHISSNLPSLKTTDQHFFEQLIYITTYFQHGTIWTYTNLHLKLRQNSVNNKSLKRMKTQ